MAWKCSNCGISHSGCPCNTKKKASDGKQCCTKCIAAYEAKLKQLKRR
jgi:hypothetical protein